jgi:predicted transcriptional regulator
MSAREDIAFLVGSEVRIDLLQRLRSAPARPSDLADRCSCARETAQRTVSGFADRGWAEKVADTDRYRLTHAGEMIAGSYAEFEERLDVATRFRHLLENLDGPVDGLTCELLAETARTRATPENPHAPVNRLLELMDREHIATLRGMTPIVSRVFNQAAAGVIGPETDADLIVDRDVLDASAAEYPEALERAEQLSGFTLYVSPEAVEFGLVLIDGHALLGAYDDQGNLVASADSDEDPFVSWARDAFARVRERSSVRN